MNRYGKPLAYVYAPDGKMFNETLLEEGYAQAYPYPPDTKYHERFARGQRQAREAGCGIRSLARTERFTLANRGNGIGEGTSGC